MVNEMGKYRGQRGMAQATRDLANACLEIIAQVQPITVRGVCYRLFVAGLIDSMAVKNTQKISRLLVRLRENGRLPWQPCKLKPTESRSISRSVSQVARQMRVSTESLPH
jgi:hypothetical protein